VGGSGAGHFVKMIHNGIEYGAMQAYAEGFAIMKKKEEFDLNLPEIAEIWRFGSVIRFMAMDLISDGLNKNPELKDIAPYVSRFGRRTLDCRRSDCPRCCRTGNNFGSASKIKFKRKRFLFR